MSKNKKLILHVMFDTNVLYTQLASELVVDKVKDVIKDNASHPDLQIEWHIPELVVKERKFQMLKKASELLPNLNKLERLIGLSFAIDDDTLGMHVDKVIAERIDENTLKVAAVDTSKVDWESIIERSVMRLQPFEDNDKEKGFRDAVIGQTLLQLCSNQPVTPSICLVVFVCNDSKLQNYVVELTRESKNVRVLSSIEELEALINARVSEITEEMASKLSQKAEDIFFQNDGKANSFFYKNEVGAEIDTKFSKELEASHGYRRTNKHKLIGSTFFDRKDRQTIHWVTTVGVEFELYQYIDVEKGKHLNEARSGLIDFDSMLRRAQAQAQARISANIQGKSKSVHLGLDAVANQEKKIEETGTSEFKVHWTTRLSKHGDSLVAAKLVKIEYVGDSFD